MTQRSVDRASSAAPPVDPSPSTRSTGALAMLQREDPARAAATIHALVDGIPATTPAVAARLRAVLTATATIGCALDPAVATHALGLACTLVSPFPTEHPDDDPTRLAATARDLARAGVDAGPAAIEGEHGILALLRDTGPMKRIEREGRIEATADLADWAASVTLDRIPPAAIASAERMLGNIGALVVAAMASDPLRRLVRDLPDDGGERWPLLRATETRSVSDAALLYGIAAHLEDFDDTHLASVVHPGSCVVPVALALWPSLRPGGDDLVTAIAVGAETAIRLGLVLQPALRRGWHMSSLVAPMAAAVTAGRLLGLDAASLRRALGLAAGGACGVTESLGTLAKPLHLGRGASVGLHAAMRARDADADAAAGAAAHLGDDPVGALLAALGADGRPATDDRWHVQDTAVKPYACGVLGHGPIDHATDARRSIPVDEIASAELRVSPLAMQAMGRTSPTSALEAKFSLSHAVAVGLVRGSADPEDFTSAAVADPVVRRIRERVLLLGDASLDRFASVLAIRMRDGREVVLRSHEPRPLDTGGVQRKAARLLEPALGERAQAVVASMCAPRDADLAPLWAIPQDDAAPPTIPSTPTASPEREGDLR